MPHPFLCLSLPPGLPALSSPYCSLLSQQAFPVSPWRWCQSQRVIATAATAATAAACAGGSAGARLQEGPQGSACLERPELGGRPSRESEPQGCGGRAQGGEPPTQGPPSGPPGPSGQEAPVPDPHPSRDKGQGAWHAGHRHQMLVCLCSLSRECFQDRVTGLGTGREGRVVSLLRALGGLMRGQKACWF